MILSERLNKLRKAAGLSQEEVADKLEVTRQTVSKWETGQSSPDLDKVLPLCELYGVTPDELLHDGGSEEAEEVKAEHDFAKYEESAERIVAKRKLSGILGGVLLYVIAIAFIMVSIPVFGMNPVIASAIFLILLALATIIIVYTAIIYRDKTKEKKPDSHEQKLYKSIDGVLGAVSLTAYLTVSFLTMAWHITWIIWIIYVLVSQIVKLIIMVKTGKDIDEE